MSNTIEGMKFTVEDSTGIDYTESNINTISLPTLDATTEVEYNFQNFEGITTFDGKVAVNYPNSDVWIYNSDSGYGSKDNILDTIRKDSNSVLIYDEYTKDFLADYNYYQIINKINVSFKLYNEFGSNTVEKIQITPNKEHPEFKTDGNFDIRKWILYISEINNKSFINYPFSQSIPYNRDDSKEKNSKIIDYVDIVSQYNFYDKDIETKKIFENENQIPNLYETIQEKEKKNNQKNIGDLYQDLKEKEKIYNKFVFTREEYRNFLAKADDYLSTFPMHNQIIISSNYEMILQRIFDNVDLSQYISQNYNLSNNEYSIPIFQFSYEKNDSFNSFINKSFRTINTKVVPLFNVIDNIEFNDDELFFGIKKDLSRMKETLKKIILATTSEKYNKYKRTLQDIYTNKPCYSETLVYRISKYKKDSNKKISEVYLPNLSKTELKYIDTQVRYDIDYRYDITAYVLIYSSCYTYTLQENTEDYANFDVLLRPSFLITEIPYYSEECYIVDYPPVHPFADFYNYKNVDNKILINFQQNSGIYEKYPIILSKNELEKVRRFLKFIKRGEQDKVIYKSDDLITKIIVYRTENIPRNYYSFAPKLSFDTKNATSFVDTIEPNKKYYYVFRSIDIHNNLSDPSPVYQVELKKINDSTYLEIDIYQFQSNINKEEKTFRRYLYIDGGALQTMINFEKSGLQYISPAGNITEGKTAKELDSSPVYGRGTQKSIFDSDIKFKVRVKSINSGKKFDILLDFNTQHKK